MPTPMPQVQDAWLELGDAAALLGVHATTLRRWTDEGKVPFYRTPGGRRRFRASELRAFMQRLKEGEWPQETATAAYPIVAVSVAHSGMSQEPWYGKFNEGQRSALRSEGRQMMAVLMQYATRTNGGEVFLQEGRRMAGDYAEACCTAGLSLVETAQAFVRVRRSIMDSAYEAGALAGQPDADTWRLYDRMNTFLDVMLLATLEAYDATAAARRHLTPEASSVQ